MENKTLDQQLTEAKELKEQRIKQAKDNQIIDKACTILDVFGKKVLFSFDDRVYKQNGLKIEQYSQTLCIQADKEIVFNAGNWVTHIYQRYLPGEWETKFEKIYQEAKIIKDEGELATLKASFPP